MTGKRILIVEDNPIVAFSLQRKLSRLGYTPLEPVDSGEAAMDAAAAQCPDLILMDVRLSGEMDGIDAAEHIRAARPVPVIFLTGHAHDVRLQQVVYLSKPVAEEELFGLMEQVLHPNP